MKKYKIGDVVDLDDVAISPAANVAWQAAAIAGAKALAILTRGVLPEIPDEQGLWLASGELEIFVEVRIGQHKPVRISLRVPPGEWHLVPR